MIAPPLCDPATERGVLSAALEGVPLDPRLTVDHFVGADTRAAFRILAAVMPCPAARSPTVRRSALRLTPFAAPFRAADLTAAIRAVALADEIRRASLATHGPSLDGCVGPAERAAYRLAAAIDEIATAPAMVGPWAYDRLEELRRRRLCAVALSEALGLVREGGTGRSVGEAIGRAWQALRGR